MRIGDYDLESPLMNGGGVVKSLEDVRHMAQTGVGAIVAGSYTLEPRVGNNPHGDTVVYHHDPDYGITYNSLGMPNHGLEAVAKDLPEMINIAHDADKPLVLNFAPVTGNPEAEVKGMFDILEKAGITRLDAIELNASCPNVVTANGGRHEILSHPPKRLQEVTEAFWTYADSQVGIDTLAVRISPFRNGLDAVGLVEAIRNNVHAITAFNTFPNGRPKHPDGRDVLGVPGGIGGQSGPGMSGAAELQTMALLAAEGMINAQSVLYPEFRPFALIGSNGVHDAESMKRRLDLGANAVSATTLFYESANRGLDWKRAVDNLLTEYAELVEA